MKRPNNRRNLDMAIRRVTGSEQEFVKFRTTMANAIVSQMIVGGVIKGGSALKLRYGSDQTRFTTDLDAACSVDIDEFVEELGERLALGWEGFTGRIVPRKQASPENVPEEYVMRPFEVKMDYYGRPWCTVPLELGHNEIGDADACERFVSPTILNMFDMLGFPGPDAVPLMRLSHQVAQKLHGLSEESSSRVHDLVDLQLIVRNSSLELSEIRSVCDRLFAYRRKQTWPCVIKSRSGWQSLYENAAFGLPVEQDLELAVEWANRFIQDIASA